MWNPYTGELLKEYVFSYSLTGNDADKENITSPIKSLVVRFFKTNKPVPFRSLTLSSMLYYLGVGKWMACGGGGESCYNLRIRQGR